MMIYGALLGYLLFEMFSGSNKSVKTEKVRDVSEKNDDIDKYK